MSNHSALLAHLNPGQRAAVLAGDGHLVINAVAGTGKTSVMAARILHLQTECGVAPQAILAVSFSRAARANLLQRVDELSAALGMGSAVPVLTLHGLSYRIVRLGVVHGEISWLRRGFSLLPGHRSGPGDLFVRHGGELVRGLRDCFPLEARIRIYSKALDMVRQGHPQLSEGGIPLTPDELPEGSIDVPDGNGLPEVNLANLATVWSRHNALLRQENALDFAGLVTEALGVLYQPASTARERFEQDLRYLLVDEYQDTSKAQEELVQCLASERVSVNVVGDSDQSIYAFNGADVRNLLDFRERMADAGQPVLPPVYLVENYRSSPNILDAANRVLARAGVDPAKRLRPADGPVSPAVDAYRESNWPVTRVLARTPEVAAPWVAAEIQHLMTSEGVEPQEIAVLVRKDTKSGPQGRVVRDALTALGLDAQKHDRDPQRTTAVLEAVHEFLNRSQIYTLELSDLHSRVVAGTYDQELGTATRDEALALLAEAAKAGAQSAYEVDDMIYDLASPDPTPPDLTGVQVRTIHSAKGLEFRVVFLFFVGEEEFPTGKHPDIPEERRLFYVGITRAMDRLYVVGRPAYSTLDSFFDEIAGTGLMDVAVEGAPPKVGAPPAVPVDDLVRQQAEAARRQQRDGEAQRRRQR